ncbi:acyl-CoA dehydrogenase family protein [Burkholderia latens]|uniref:Acyl-CoA dehydrogenase n=1 Tax=Burkholderia latens TaxID=488446 RepID=A0A6H9SE73_9BURK|nr:acyl-CoA dehydrogenase family protein [Burkholderia latens]KAB0631422.1 acyl-CoA dehydrogenase [Burkholderia latens]VWC21726.1 acyl-CoA dehydrogenase [Burkholderia latens]
MSASLAASSSQSSLRHLPADDARVAALLERLAPELAADAARNDVDGRFPHENFARLHRAGLIAQVVPREHGGAGATLAQASRIVAAIARADPATALVLTMTYLQHRALGRADNRWPEPVRRAVFRSAVEEGALINALRVEPALGSPSRGGLPDTIARRDDDGWRLSGHKLYSTGIPALRWLAVWARTDEREPRVGVFVVRRDVADDVRIRVIESWNHLGLRASGSHEVVFDDVWLPADHAVDVRAPAAWAVSAASHADADAQADQHAWMVALLGSLYDAVARASRDWLLDFATTRAPSGLGASLATLPRVQEAVGEIEGWLHANHVLLDDHIARTDAGDAPAVTTSGLVKRTVTENAIRTVEQALKLSGNHGLSRHNPLERHYRDVLCGRVHTPQDDAIAVAAGRAALDAAAAARSSSANADADAESTLRTTPARTASAANAADADAGRTSPDARGSGRNDA